MELFKKLFPVSAAAVMALGLLAAAPQPAQAQWGMGEDAGLWGAEYGYADGVFEDDEFYEDYEGYYGTEFEDEEEWGDWW